MIPVILCGGVGVRLWPLSRADAPKQFLDLGNDDTLFRQSLLRAKKLSSEDYGVIVANRQFSHLIASQMEDLGKLSFDMINEPIGRNTAAAVIMAALHLDEKCSRSSGEDPVLVIMPSDQLIQDEDQFRFSVEKAVDCAQDGALVLLGVKASSPHTGFGYIFAGEAASEDVFLVDKFVEKPNESEAKTYVSRENSYWNSGIFIGKASVILAEAQEYEPEVFEKCVAAFDGRHSGVSGIDFDKDIFGSIPSKSFDKGILEKSSSVMMVPLAARWSDQGSWDSVWKERLKDNDENVVIGDVFLWQSNRNFFFSSGKLVLGVEVDDLVVIDAKDAILVAKRGSDTGIRKAAEWLESNNRVELETSPKVKRPWGSYENLDRGTNHLTKRIIVYPGQKLSLQRHQHRAEHWVVVDGVADVVLGNKEFTLERGGSIFIPEGEIHRVENSGDTDLLIIETQLGSQIREDDIERLEDMYGRV